MNEDRRAVLEGIAYGSDPKVTPADRLKALELLGGPAADNDTTFDLSGLSGAQLDKELAGFFATGWTGPNDTPDDRAAVTPAQERELRKRLRSGFAQIEYRVQERAEQIAAALRPQTSSEDVEPEPTNVVPMPRARDRETPRQREARLRAEHRSAVASGEFGAAEAAAWDPMIELNRWDD